MAKILPKFKNNILNKSFVSISKAAKFLQVSPDTLRNWEKDGKLIPSRTYGGARRYSRVELMNLKKELRPFASKRKGLVSISKAAKALQVSPDTLRNWDKKGLIESARSKGGARRFTREEVQRLQKELGIEVISEPQKDTKALIEAPKSSQEFHSFSFPWLKTSFFVVLAILSLSGGWFSYSYISPLEHKIDQTSKILTEAVGSIESLQRGVLGIQTQNQNLAQPSPSPLVLPSNLNIKTANPQQSPKTTLTAVSPLALDTITGQISCVTCLTSSLDYLSSVTNSDGMLNINTSDKQATITLNLEHANTWNSPQTFAKGGYFTDGLYAFALDGNPAAIFEKGNVGVGVIAPVNKLDVAGAQAIGSDYAGKYSAPENGLLVQGNVGIGLSVPSYHLDVAGGARFGCSDANLGDGPTTSCSDVAEIYQSDGSVDVGDIVAFGSQPNIASKSTKPYQQGMLGVYSTSPGLLIGGQTILGSNGNLIDHNIPVALVGRVVVKVSDENGPIEIGDYLTSSSIPGVAMKATKPGPVIGQALESFDFSTSKLLASTEEDSHLVEIKAAIGKILIVVNVSYADPKNFLASLALDDDGNLIVPKIRTSSITLDPYVASAASQLAVSSDQSTIIGQNTTSISPDLASSSNIDLSGEIASLEDRIQNQELRIKELEAKAVSTGNVGIGTTASSSKLMDNLIIHYEQAIQPKNEATNSAVTLTQTATSSSVLTTSNQLSVTDLHLTPPDILLATPSAMLANIKVTDTFSSEKLLRALDANISGKLNVFGETLLANTTIAGDLVVDGTLSLDGTSLNVIGSSLCVEKEKNCGILYIQNSPLAYQVNFFNGLVTIDKTGNLKAQSITVAGFKVVANKISGSGRIIAGQKSIEIENTQVSPASRILITPTTETTLVMAVAEKVEGKKFIVSTSQTADKDLNFDWFLINESPEF